MEEKTFELIERLKEDIYSERDFHFWKYINELEEVLPHIKSENKGEIRENVVIKGNLVLGENSIIHPGTVIDGNVLIGNNCNIGPNAYLRENVYVGNNCHIGISEVKNSIILNNSNVPHFNYVGDSVIGEDSNLGAGTIIANLRHDQKTIRVLINGEKVDSGRVKLGAFIGSNTKTGINASINCGTFLRNNSKILPSEFVK